MAWGQFKRLFYRLINNFDSLCIPYFKPLFISAATRRQHCLEQRVFRPKCSIGLLSLSCRDCAGLMR